MRTARPDFSGSVRPAGALCARTFGGQSAVIGPRCARSARDIFISGERYINGKVKECAAREGENPRLSGVRLAALIYPVFASRRARNVFPCSRILDTSVSNPINRTPRCNALSIISAHPGAMSGFLYRVYRGHVYFWFAIGPNHGVCLCKCSDWKCNRETKPKRLKDDLSVCRWKIRRFYF